MPFDYLSFIEMQLAMWPLAKSNYDKLADVERKVIRNGKMPWPVAVQYNPGRAKSSFADISKAAIEKRPCFLCRKNRPKDQFAADDIVPEFEVLVNPYPIFPVHLTIACKRHIDQNHHVPGAEMIYLVDKAPDLACFFNGAKAGASAPDHLHFQAVLKSELPLLAYIETVHPPGASHILCSDDITCSDLPIRFTSFIVASDTDSQKLKIILDAVNSAAGRDENGHPDPQRINVYVWIDNQNLLRILTLHRTRHRPHSYFAENDKEKIMISPGGIDLAGVYITPRKEDFDKVTDTDLFNITKDVFSKSDFT